MSHADDWPRTSRVVPWLVAAFLCVLWLVPADAIELPINLPIDPHPDRFVLAGLAVAALAATLVDRRYSPSTPAPGVAAALLGFAAVALASIALNAKTLAGAGELDQGIKQFALLCSVPVVFFVVATAIRPTELRRFAVLLVALASVAAVGTIYEYRSDYNVFYGLADTLFGGFATVDPPPAQSLDSRDESFGPTEHGLAIVTMLTLALPFAVVGLMGSRTPRRRLAYGVSVALIVTAAVATQRKTSVIAPGVAMLVVAAYRPRQLLRLAPLGLAVLLAAHLAAPAALGGVMTQLTGGFFDSGSTIGRTADYEAVRPDIATHPLLGRGYGTLDISRPDTYRILDNQYLGWLVQVGFLGLAAYLALLAAAMALAHAVARRGVDADARDVGLAALAGFAAFAVANVLFDLASFIQVPYLFCFIAGLCSVAYARTAPAPLALPGRAATR